MDRKDLKIEHYKQKVAELSVQYEDKIADLRVELTLVSQEKDELARELQAYRDRDDQPTESLDDVVVTGEVVDVSEEDNSEAV